MQIESSGFRVFKKMPADEHLQAIAAGLLGLEKPPAPDEQRRLVETVFRAAHSLKGAARAVNFTEVESICQSLEDAFAAWKRQESIPSPQALDMLHGALDAVARIIEACREGPFGARVADVAVSDANDDGSVGFTAKPTL